MVLGGAEAMKSVIHDPSLFSVLVLGMENPNELIAMRSADAVEKLTRDIPEWLRPHKSFLMHLIDKTDQQEVRWHLAQIIPRLELTLDERKTFISIFEKFLTDKSRILVTFSMQAMVDLAGNDTDLKDKILPPIQRLTRIGSGAMRARGKKLLKQMESS